MAFVGEDLIPEEPLSRNCLEDAVLPRVEISAPVFKWIDSGKQASALAKPNDANPTTPDPALTSAPATAATAATAATPTAAPAIATAAAPCVRRSSPDLLVIGVSGVGQCFLTAQLRRAERLGHPAKTPTKVATMSSARAKCSLFYLPGSESPKAPYIMFALFEDHECLSCSLGKICTKNIVEANQSFLWAKTLFHHVQPSRVVVFDSYKAATFVKRKKEKRPELPFVRMLKSSALHKIVVGLTVDKSIKIRELNSPNIVEGLPAALLSRCEVHSIPAALILSAIGLQVEIENVECLLSTVPFIQLLCPGVGDRLCAIDKVDLLPAWKEMSRSAASKNLYL